MQTEGIFNFIVNHTSQGKIDKETAIRMIAMLKQGGAALEQDIAIIGMAARFPGAEDIHEYWDNIQHGLDMVSPFPDSRREDLEPYLRHMGMTDEQIRYAEYAYLDNINCFDPAFFRISPKEASLMDPHQRLFLEVAWKAIEEAGYGGEKLAGSNTGVYLGYAPSPRDLYARIVYDVEPDQVPIASVGNMPAITASRISYLLDLKGPSLVIDTACSSALVAIDLACQSIKHGHCDMAIAGGIKLNIVPIDMDNMRIGIESSDWRTRAFDDASDGSGIGEGAGAVLLKPLSKALRDRDHIYAVIKGSSANHDGTTAGITVPNPASQTEVIAKAWEEARINPETITYMEAHGTGTRLGDPIEVQGIEGAFRRYTDKRQFCAISSVKSNMGHMCEAAGIASLIKMAMALKHKQLPQTIHFNKPNTTVDFCDSPIYVNTKLREWQPEGHPRRGSISSFGMSGTNCHLVLEEALEPEGEEAEERLSLFTLSAKSLSALVRMIAKYQRFVQHADDALRLDDLCYTANTGRGAYSYRLAVVVESLADLSDKLNLLSEMNMEQLNVPWAFYAYHKVVRSNKEELALGELTEQGKLALKEQADLRCRDWFASGKKDKAVLDSLSALYVKGADIRWEALYEGEKRQRISLPTYSFDPIRCWVDPPLPADGISDQEAAGDKNLFYGVTWVQEERPGKANPQQGKVLVFCGKEGDEALAASLGGEGTAVITVAPGQRFEKIGPHAFLLMDEPEQYSALLREVGLDGLVRIIHMQTLRQGDVTSLEELEERQRAGVYSLLHLYQALTEAKLQQELELVILTDYACEADGSEGLLKPENAPLIGLGKVLTKEQALIKCRSIDWDEQTPAEVIREELNSRTTGALVAYRKGQRFVEAFGPIPVKPSSDAVLREGGAYVITGGAGGIGLEIAKALSAQARIVVALINRSSLPDRSSWETIVEANENQKTIKIIKSIQDIEASGSRVEYYSADISSEADVQAVLENLRLQYKEIRGVIHAAGVAMDELLVQKHDVTMKKVLAPKVAGTWLLDRLTAQDPLDFFVMFSSVATIFSAVTQGDYAAANAYMDAFASYRNKRGNRTLTVNWTTWKETGMAAETGAAVDTIFRTLPTSRGTEAFMQALRSKTDRTLIGEINDSKMGLLLLERSQVRLTEDLSQVIERKKSQLPQKKASSPSSQAKNGTVQLTGRSDDAYNEMERKVALVCKSVLGFHEIDVFDNFFELGADSILLMRIHAELDQQHPGLITVADMFEYSNISKLAQFMLQKTGAQGSPGAQSQSFAREAAREKGNEGDPTGEIAVIGMSFRFPMADNTDEFWSAMVNSQDMATIVPESRQEDIKRYIKFKKFPVNAIEFEEGAYLEDIDKFDYRYFRLSPREASLTDPNHRLFLQTAWEAMEDAGYGGDGMLGSQTGIYLGFASNMLYYHRFISEIDPDSESMALVGNTASVAAGRTSYLFDLKGPSMVVDTACSASLVAVHLACKSIRNGDCEMAIAGGVKVNLLPVHRKGSPRGIGMESSDGRTRTFDQWSDGTGSGEGVAAILLKPLKKAIADRDNIYAVIKGSASNQDGSSAGLTAPNPAAQEEVIVKAWKDAGIDPETITYMEAHGTGTQLGDPIEIQGIANAFRRFTDKKQFCAIGSAKSNLTHLAEAAGIAGVIKAILALRNKQLPPNLYFHRPNRKIDFSQSPVYVNTVSRKWETAGYPRRCGVSGFGMSGTNCHVVLEEYVGAEETKQAGISGSRLEWLVLSAKTESALQRLVRKYTTFIRVTSSSLHNICYTAAAGRGHHSYRLAILAESLDDARRKLEHVARVGVAAAQEPWYAYGHHKIVPASKGQLSPGEMTERYRIQLGEDAALKVECCKNGTDADSAGLSGLGRLYAQGADVDWKELYRGESVYRVSLPTYAFDLERCWIEIPEYEDAPLALPSAGQFHGGRWMRQPLGAAAPGRTREGAVVLFHDEAGIGEQLAHKLAQQGTEVIHVKWGVGYSRTGERQFTIGGEEEDYATLLRELKPVKPARMIHLFSIMDGSHVTDYSQLIQSQKRGVYSLFYLSKAAAKIGLSGEVDLVLVSKLVEQVSGKEAALIPHGAPLFGLGKAVRLEQSNLKCRCIDMDEPTDVEQLFQEIIADPGIYQSAYRENERYLEEFGDFPVQQAEEERIELHEEGVYVITGGLGGMGIEVSKYLASRKRVNLALLSRSAMPPREEWDRIVRDNSRMNAKLIQRIQSVQEIERLGAHVVCRSVDVSELEDMKRVLDELRSQYGRINGIVHGAGVAGDGYLYVKEEKRFNEVVLPKVYGTWILDHLTAADHPDFFVLFSSVSSIFAAAGQGDYAAANAYLDAYARYRRNTGKKTLVINWVAWRDTGMAVDYGVNADGTFKAISTSLAMSSFDLVFHKAITRVMIGEINPEADTLWELKQLPVLLAPNIDAAVHYSIRKKEARQQASQKFLEGEIKLKGKAEGYTDLEAKLAAIYCEVLGFSEIDIEDNFFELGGDSILLGRVHHSLEKLFPGQVRLMDLFEHTSISKLHRFLTSEGEPEHTGTADADEDRRTEELLQAIEAGQTSIGGTPDLPQEDHGEAGLMEEDTRHLLEALEQGNLSIEQAIERMKREGLDEDK
ncbi:SDR family NAD(P)-dependent oxidoreductase [Gorillibacterium sp. sgz500922]|uniref:SDR family NAD(P)-dependent oxidoreductase n=1 Tax=Gorillibacterium sp. sgz500922 TaxID=3446694 RepID=UPI003F666B92